MFYKQQINFFHEINYLMDGSFFCVAIPKFILLDNVDIKKNTVTDIILGDKEKFKHGIY